eukprot:Nitzschia sp. Nitz4//scaffold4_size323378//290485//291216//NITZ4_000712-RA/size323378-processed-gene-0.312-mRNA-1//1//CDS//3329553555//7478//frame0
MAEDYGYGPGAPDSDKYGYGDAAPDINTSIYGYGDGAPDVAQGQGEAGMPLHRPERQGRRSSMKQQGIPRRSSIGYRGETTVMLPGHRKPVRRRTSISFEGEVQVKEVRPVGELTDQPERLWFQAEEYNVIREKAIFVTELASTGADKLLASEKKLCTRGLESHIDKDSVDMEQYIAWRSVFEEQFYQRQDGQFDDEAVAKMYEMASLPSRLRALERAQGDVKDAERHTKGIRKELRRHSLLV